MYFRTLPAQFPQERPVVTVSPGVRHPWVDTQMKVTGCPSINNVSNIVLIIAYCPVELELIN